MHWFKTAFSAQQHFFLDLTDNSRAEIHICYGDDDYFEGYYWDEYGDCVLVKDIEVSILRIKDSYPQLQFKFEHMTDSIYLFFIRNENNM
jgi:hypothetical protein